MILLPFFIVQSIVVGLAVAHAIFGKRRERHKNLPPYSPESMWQNVQASLVQKSLYQLQRVRKFLLGVDPKSVGFSEQGSTFILALPLLNYFIVTSDIVLARGVLGGENGIAEGEKATVMRVMNLVDADQDNLISHQTANADIGSARKAIAPAFSTINLTLTWPHVKGVLGEQFAKFRQTAASGGTVDCASTMVQFFLRTLSRGAFDIEFTDDGTENEGNINGLAYLQESDLFVREANNQLMIPFRRYMWWDSDVRRAVLANKRMGEMMSKIVRLHRQKGEKDGKHTILDHVMGHNYKSETQRLCDLASVTVASVDTTAHALCFLLIDLSRRPDVKVKLLAALETVMPDRFEAEGGSVDAGRELMSKLASLEYLSWCIKESMRLWPVGAGGPARDLTQDVHHNGMLLPKGSVVCVSLFSMFRSPWIDRAEEFVPERWGAQNPQLARLQRTVIPFSMGRRTCLGHNMAIFQLRAVAAHFLHFFDFELQGEPTFEFFITLKVDDMQMKIRPREGRW